MPLGFQVTRKTLLPDLIAGATFAVINVPQAMANAVLASVNPVAGLYALMIAMPIGALFTSSVFMNISTTGALSVAVGEALLPFEGDQKYQALLALVLMVGALQMLFGLLKFGQLLRFISHSVMTGFVTGIAVLIVLGSVSDITGFESAQRFHVLRLAETVLSWRILDLQTLIIGLGTVALILLFQRTALRKFALVLALVAATLSGLVFAHFLTGGAVLLVGDVATIPRYLPYPSLPDFEVLPEVLVPAFAIAVIGLIQGAGVGQNYPNPDRSFPDASRDFVGQGAANLAASTFGAVPSGGSMSGTAVSVGAGARTRWANIFAGAAVILIVLFFADLVKLVPMAALGGLLFVVGLQNIQPDHIRSIWANGSAAKLGMSITFLATLLLPLHFAIVLGVAVSFVLQVLNMANRVDVREIELVEGGFPVEKETRIVLSPGEVRVARVRGALFFASAQALEAKLPQARDADQATLILSLWDIDDLGSTMIRFLHRYSQEMSNAGATLVLSGVTDSLYEQFRRTGLLNTIGVANVFRQQPEMGASLNAAVLSARSRRPRQ